MTATATRVVHCSYPCCQQPIGRIETTPDGPALAPVARRDTGQ